MDKIVQELRKVIKFKPTTDVGDIVLVAIEKPQSVFYAMVTAISRDDNVKDEWWNVTLAILGVPLQKVTWTLRGPQFTGQEIFTMAGEARFIQALDFSEGSSGEGLNKVSSKTAPEKGGPVRLRRIK